MQLKSLTAQGEHLPTPGGQRPLLHRGLIPHHRVRVVTCCFPTHGCAARAWKLTARRRASRCGSSDRTVNSSRNRRTAARSALLRAAPRPCSQVLNLVTAGASNHGVPAEASAYSMQSRYPCLFLDSTSSRCVYTVRKPDLDRPATHITEAQGRACGGIGGRSGGSPAPPPGSGVPMKFTHGTSCPPASPPLLTRRRWQLGAPNVARAALSFSSALHSAPRCAS